jgi:uncharacterized OB-fold protein
MIAPGLVELTPTGAHLVAGRRVDGTLVFPYPEQSADACERVVLAARGTLWSWTVQRFRPKSPPYVGVEGAFSPYLVGYVEFPEGLIVEGRIAARVDRDALRVGQAMEVTIAALFVDGAGEPVHLFAFRPLDLAEPKGD